MKHFQMNVFQGRKACGFLDQITKIVGGKAELTSTIGYRGNALQERLIGGEIVVEQLVEAFQQLLVYGLSGNYSAPL